MNYSTRTKIRAGWTIVHDGESMVVEETHGLDHQHLYCRDSKGGLLALDIQSRFITDATPPQEKP